MEFAEREITKRIVGWGLCEEGEERTKGEEN